MVIVGSEKGEWRFSTEFDYGSEFNFVALEEAENFEINNNFHKQFIKLLKD